MARKDNSIWISTDLILSNTKYDDTESVLIMSGESIDLIEAVSDVAKEVHVYDTSWRRLNQLRQFVKSENVVLSDAVYPDANSYFDTALIFVPKGREFSRAQMSIVMQALRIGGSVYLAGPNKGGAKTMIRDAATLFGECTVLDYKKSHRVAVSTRRGDFQYPADWGIVPYQMHDHIFETPLGTLKVISLPGVFSWNELDDGTEYLLENLDFRDANSFLDMGCGNGVIGALASRRIAEVTLVDDNLLAVYCAKQTLEANNLANCTALPSDVYSQLSGRKFDIIVSNPPFHHKFDQDSGAAERIIGEAPSHLEPGGRLVIVCNAFLRYEHLMSDTFKQWRIVAQNSKFKVLEGVNR